MELDLLSSSYLPPPPPPPPRYNVFLSFHGVNTRKTITSHLWAALKQNRFTPFIDETDLRRGEDITPKLLNSIEESAICIVVFSENYADSTYCLDELVHIMECRRKWNRIVMPVFYSVRPSVVECEIGSYRESIEKHKENFEEVTVERWRAALVEAAAISGRDLQTDPYVNGYESKFIEKIVEDVARILKQRVLHVTTYPVGTESRASDVELRLRVRPNDIRVIAIWGPGGIGKTTTAIATYNRVQDRFERCSFLANIGETFKQSNGLVNLQKQLVSDILLVETNTIDNEHQGRIKVENALQGGKRVLIVLDDVLSAQHVTRLGIMREFLHAGSRVIVTTREKSSVNSLGIDAFYEPMELNQDESLQLFSWNAFQSRAPREGYEAHSKEMVAFTGGFPLVLEIIGSSMRYEPITEWPSCLARLREVPNSDVHGKLITSFNSLLDIEKELFKDIACFFIGYDKDFTIKVLEDPQCSTRTGISILDRRCLVKVDYAGRLRMHDTIRDMGREIVRQESKKKGKRSRLWRQEDVLEVLRDCTGTEAVEGLSIGLKDSNNEEFNANALSSMNSLKLLHLNNVSISGSYEHLSRNLKWLSWEGFPLKFVPSQLCIENLVAIDLQHSKLNKLWEGTPPKSLGKLKFLNLSHSNLLKETPEFSGLHNLEQIQLHDCTSLEKVHDSIGVLHKLVVLTLHGCKNLTELPFSALLLESLKNLDLTGCSKLGKLCGFKGPPSNSWVSFFFSWAWRRESIEASGTLSASILRMSCLERLILKDCNFSCLPSEMKDLASLRLLNLSGNKFSGLPSCIGELSKLHVLCMNNCIELQSVSDVPGSLCRLNARGCTNLKTPPDMSKLDWSIFTRVMNFHGCSKSFGNEFVKNFRRQLLLQLGQISNLVQRPEEFRPRPVSIEVFLPACDILPDHWLDCQSEEDVITIMVPPLKKRKCHGLLICVVFESRTENDVLSFEIKNLSMFKYRPERIQCFTVNCGKQTWLTYISDDSVCCLLDNWVEFRHVHRFIIGTGQSATCTVKKWGVRVIREGDEEDNALRVKAQMRIEYLTSTTPSLDEEKLDFVNFNLLSPVQKE